MDGAAGGSGVAGSSAASGGTARTAAERAVAEAALDGLQHYWRCDECSGKELRDCVEPGFGKVRSDGTIISSDAPTGGSVFVGRESRFPLVGAFDTKRAAFVRIHDSPI